MQWLTMRLKIILPSAVFIDVDHVQQVNVETPMGAYGLLPRRLDCATSVVPGILTYVTADDIETFVAVDEGVLIKHDQQVMVAVRRAFIGSDLAQLQDHINQQFLQQNEARDNRHRLQQRLESGFLRRFADFRDA